MVPRVPELVMVSIVQGTERFILRILQSQKISFEPLELIKLCG